MHSLLANVRQFPLIAVAAVLLLLCIVVSLFIAPIWLAFGLMLVLATLVAALIKSHTAEELSAEICIAAGKIGLVPIDLMRNKYTHHHFQFLHLSGNFFLVLF